MPDETFGPYRIERQLGRGGMGVVHRAFDTRRGPTVALKRLPGGASADSVFIERFRRESELAARLNNALTLTEPQNIIAATTYSQCVQWILDVQADALVTDDAIIKGYAASSGGTLRVVQDPSGLGVVSEYGIGLAHDDTALRAEINAILQEAIDSGDWARIYADNLGPSGAPGTPPAIRPY